MEKKSHSLLNYLSPVKLYLDDIEEIINKIQFVCSKVKIANKDYEFDSIEEFINNSGKKIKELSIDGRSPNISIDIKKFKINLFTTGETEAVIGLWYNLKEFLKSKSAWYSRFLNAWVWGLTLWSFLFISKIILDITISYPEVYKVVNVFSIVILAILLLFFLLSLLKHWNGSTIHLERRHKASNFWERNRDNIITGLIGAIIGATITLAGQFLIKSISK
jgi:hypothetical protein